MVGHIKIKGLSKIIKFSDRLDQAHRTLKASIDSESNKFGDRSVKQLRKAMKSRKTGKVYRIGGRNHRASASGEAPAYLTGTLYKGTTYDISERGKSTRLNVGYTTPYGRWLEGGTSKMGARPNIVHLMGNSESLIHPIMKRLTRILRF